MDGTNLRVTFIRFRLFTPVDVDHSRPSVRSTNGSSVDASAFKIESRGESSDHRRTFSTARLRALSHGRNATFTMFVRRSSFHSHHGNQHFHLFIRLDAVQSRCSGIHFGLREFHDECLVGDHLRHAGETFDPFQPDALDDSADTRTQTRV